MSAVSSWTLQEADTCLSVFAAYGFMWVDSLKSRKTQPQSVEQKNPKTII